WDLNPRMVAHRRFSRPVHSAALPPLRSSAANITMLIRLVNPRPVRLLVNCTKRHEKWQSGRIKRFFSQIT
ncbi:hypothetical protein, partial [Aeromonas veronii]|uniref:hypothetical protein n=1 Tax=Aeromonas veronii TaxID=654 RepID=UPI003D253D1E